MSALLAAARMQLRLSWRAPGDLTWLVTTPAYTIIFLAIVSQAHRDDLTAYAVLAPAIMGVVTRALFTAGELIDRDRSDGLLELLVSAPASFPALVVGRVLAIVGVSVIGLAEAWLVAGICYQKWLGIRHPTLFAVTVILLVVASAGAATAMAATFVLARSTRLFQNSLNYPLYVLGGVLVPVSLLPMWLRPASRLIYLSWASDLLRDSVSNRTVSGVAGRVAALCLLALAAYLAGSRLLRRVVDIVRASGTLGHE